MKQRCLMYAVFVFSLLLLGESWTWAQFPTNPTFTTVLTRGNMIDGVTVGQMEGLTTDFLGNFYVADRGPGCAVWKIDPDAVAPAPTVTIVGKVGTGSCRPSGLLSRANGDLVITSGGEGLLYSLTPDPGNASNFATVIVTGVPGANGVAEASDGTIYVTDGTENKGFVWRIASNQQSGQNAGNPLFRIPPRTNTESLGGRVKQMDQSDGVGRVTYTVPRGLSGGVPTGVDEQSITANGIAFNSDEDTLYIADTHRGAIWQAQLDESGNVISPTGCDTTFHQDTLCMDENNPLVTHPQLEGIDGIVLDQDGNIWADANERNAIVIYTDDGQVKQLFQNPTGPKRLRNAGPLEFPTSPSLSGMTFCTTNADFPRRDNNPSAAGEGSKVVCMDQPAPYPGLILPPGL